MPEKTYTFKSINDIQNTSWERVAGYTIFFGHQSVGYNIIDGIQDILNENKNGNIHLNIVETADAEDFTAPVFAHARVGTNTQPISKVDAFARVIKDGIGSKADIAFFKLCYVDFDAESNVHKVFDYYKTKMAELKKRYPRLTFVHVTVPLTTCQTGLKAAVKKILGRSLWGYEDNIKRNQFNDLLRKQYSEDNLLFDLALIESTFPDGTRNVQKKDSQSFYALVPEYTDDGGHLNEKGRRIVAEQLLVFLAGL
ncbi:MAG: SGNH/GDSL hydrolase family protein [Spirochaetota bacterium]